MKDKSFDALKENISEDLKQASKKEIDEIYKNLELCLKKFDKDKTLKNIKDFFVKLFKSKKDKCILLINDIVDSRDKLSPEEKEELRKCFLNISNIHRTFLEDIQALFGAL